MEGLALVGSAPSWPPWGETGGFGLRWYQSDKNTTEKGQESGGEVELAQFYPGTP